MSTGINPVIHITKFGDKYSVRIEWKGDGYFLVKSFEELIEVLKKEFEEKNDD